MEDGAYFKIIGDRLLCVHFGLVLISRTFICFCLLMFFLMYSKECKTLRISLLFVKLPSSVSLDAIFGQSYKKKNFRTAIIF
jgi:hypothetical protein